MSMNGTVSGSTTPLWGVARQSLLALTDRLARYGVYVDDGLELRAGVGLLCHYSMQDRHIYLALPDPHNASGKFMLFLLRSVVNFDESAHVMRLVELLLPWMIAHEIGHHLRHKYGLFGPSFWEEEAIANQLAIAFTKGYLTLAQQQEVRELMARAIASLSPLLAAKRAARDQGTAGDRASEVARDLIHYVHTHMIYFYRDLTAHESQTIGDFVKSHLN